VGRLKAEGMDYEDRMAELEKVDYPKPLADLIYDTFNTFNHYHPWVDGENIHPKSIARELYELMFGFHDYINLYGLARSEGVLLRYLSQVYRTALQNVPESYRTEQFIEVLTYLQTLIRRVDSSLLDEWEHMLTGEVLPPKDRHEAPLRKPLPQDLAQDFKTFSARIRSELHMLLQSLAKQDYAQACKQIRHSEQFSWSADEFQAALAPFYEEHSAIELTPRARLTEHTFLRQVAPQQWEVQQTIIDPEQLDDWALMGVIDLSAELDIDGPLVEIRSIQ